VESGAGGGFNVAARRRSATKRVSRAWRGGGGGATDLLEDTLVHPQLALDRLALALVVVVVAEFSGRGRSGGGGGGGRRLAVGRGGVGGGPGGVLALGQRGGARLDLPACSNAVGRLEASGLQMQPEEEPWGPDASPLAKTAL